MKSTSKKFTTSAAALFTFALLAMTASTAYADDYCITSGAQAAHGCGYPSMEMCRQAANGIGGNCTASPSSGNANNSTNALANLPKQPSSRIVLRASKHRTRH